MAAPVQRIAYLTEGGDRTEIVVEQGGSGYTFDNGFVSVPDPRNPSRTLLIPPHRVLLIELFTQADGAYVAPDALRKQAGDVIQAAS